VFLSGGFVNASSVFFHSQEKMEPEKIHVENSQFSTFSTDFSTAGYPQFHIPVEKESMLT